MYTKINKKRVSIPASIRTQQDQDWFYGDRLYIFDEVCKAARIKEYEELKNDYYLCDQWLYDIKMPTKSAILTLNLSLIYGKE